MSLVEDTVSCDVGELYGSLAGRLEQIVRLDVRAPDAVIEDACQFAWLRLLHHSHRVRRETAMAWLATTAVREAFKLLRRDRRELSLEAAIEEGGEPSSHTAHSRPEQLVELHERLAALDGLPERQRRLVWLHALGLNYVEIAAHEGCTRRTVDRQLLRGRHALRGESRAQPDLARD